MHLPGPGTHVSRVHLTAGRFSRVLSHGQRPRQRAGLTVRASAMNLQGITPSALAMRLYLTGPGRLQLGSAIAPRVDRIWIRPICGGRWSVVHFP